MVSVLGWLLTTSTSTQSLFLGHVGCWESNPGELLVKGKHFIHCTLAQREYLTLILQGVKWTSRWYWGCCTGFANWVGSFSARAAQALLCKGLSLANSVVFGDLYSHSHIHRRLGTCFTQCWTGFNYAGPGFSPAPCQEWFLNSNVCLDDQKWQ